MPPTFRTSNLRIKTLPAVFIDRDGEPEAIGALPAFGSSIGDGIPFSDRGEASPLPALIEQPEQAALNRLRRALFETGQLIVTPRDGISRICFAGVGDPERVFVELLPRDEPVPLQSFDASGCLCLLPKAEAILRRIYRGESSEKLAQYLSVRFSDCLHGPEAA